MAAANKVKIGWDEGESKEFGKALKQPLMVQTPLQVNASLLRQEVPVQLRHHFLLSSAAGDPGDSVLPHPSSGYHVQRAAEEGEHIGAEMMLHHACIAAGPKAEVHSHRVD
jgi:hypothetical protein